jgi:pyruvate kinase
VAPPTKSVNQMREDDPKKFLSKIGKGRRVVASPKKEKTVTQGDAAHCVFNIREGRLRITQKVKQSQLEKLIQNLSLLISEMLELEASGLIGATEVHPDHRASARNLMHYLALRRHDIRHLQSNLAALGLSSLGRTEPHVLSSLHAVLNILLKLAGSAPISLASKAAPQVGQGNHLLDRNTEALLGEAPTDRHVRIMVTMPSEAATKYELVRDLLAQGMDCMRINCAHDGPEAWSGMIRNLRRAEKETNKRCKVAMDLAGPKLRTGSIEPGPAVLKYRPQRDAFGRIVSPARIWLTPDSSPEVPPVPADAVVPVPQPWLARLRLQDRVRFTDARGASRSMIISGVEGKSRWANAVRTAYVFQGMMLEARRPALNGKLERIQRAHVGAIPAKQQTLRLKLGDTLFLTSSLDPGRPPQRDSKEKLITPAQIGVSLPEFFGGVKAGEPIWLNDGMIGGVIRKVAPDKVSVEITQARPQGEKLGAEKGINAPESHLQLSSLTNEDLKALPFVVKNADIVSYSFVRTEADVLELESYLAKLSGEKLGIILKIETREGFDHLPQLLLAVMRSRAVGVMIARGDLAIECGYERLAEVQEEILWVCEAAHMPVVWATQVLESLAKNGIPSRAEITDAAMGERAECVMLNKGPYMVTVVRILGDILRRMQPHHEKKNSLLRKLHLAVAFQSGL